MHIYLIILESVWPTAADCRAVGSLNKFLFFTDIGRNRAVSKKVTQHGQTLAETGPSAKM